MQVQFPQSCVWCVHALEDEFVLKVDGDCGCGELNLASSIAELSDGQQGFAG